MRALTAALMATVAACSDGAAPILLGVDIAKLVPSYATIGIDRATSGPVTFSVAKALPPSVPLRVYWFVDFDPETPQKWVSEADPLVLDPCQAPLADPAGLQTVVTVEALVTAGELNISFVRPGDPRYTVGGEPILPIRWTIVAQGQCPH